MGQFIITKLSFNTLILVYFNDSLLILCFKSSVCNGPIIITKLSFNTLILVSFNDSLLILCFKSSV